VEIGEITGASSGAINPVYKYILKMRITDAPSAAVNPLLLKHKKYEVTGAPPRTVNPVFVFVFPSGKRRNNSCILWCCAGNPFPSNT
jgi:hypothetical protein